MCYVTKWVSSHENWGQLCRAQAFVSLAKDGQNLRNGQRWRDAPGQGTTWNKEYVSQVGWQAHGDSKVWRSLESHSCPFSKLLQTPGQAPGPGRGPARLLMHFHK